MSSSTGSIPIQQVSMATSHASFTRFPRLPFVLLPWWQTTVHWYHLAWNRTLSPILQSRQQARRTEAGGDMQVLWMTSDVRQIPQRGVCGFLTLVSFKGGHAHLTSVQSGGWTFSIRLKIRSDGKESDVRSCAIDRHSIGSRLSSKLGHLQEHKCLPVFCEMQTFWDHCLLKIGWTTEYLIICGYPEWHCVTQSIILS